MGVLGITIANDLVSSCVRPSDLEEQRLYSGQGIVQLVLSTDP